MRTLSLTLLAASTMLIAGVATAQPAPGAHPGATWRGGAMPRPNIQMRGPNMQMGGHMQGGTVRMRGGNFQMRGGGNFRFHRWGPHPGRNFRHDRLRRGGFINSYWFAPQFYIGDWGAYGFYAPGDDQRWVRYYDDAYLIDGDGRVIDGRHGVNWDQHGEDWDDDDGIPAYRGRHGGDAEDYADEDDGEREEHGDARRHHGGAYGPMMPPPGYGPPPPGTHVYGGGYGYGMYAYPIVIETVTTSGSSGYTEEIVEEYVETRHRRRAHRARPRCSCAAPAPRPAPRRPAPRPRPRPPAGERG